MDVDERGSKSRFFSSPPFNGENHPVGRRVNRAGEFIWAYRYVLNWRWIIKAIYLSR